MIHRQRTADQAQEHARDLPQLRPEVLRAFVISSHYRGPINYTEENLRQADAALSRLYLALRDQLVTARSALP